MTPAKRKVLKHYFWFFTIAPIAGVFVTALLGSKSSDVVLDAIKSIPTAIHFMGFWILAAITALRMDAPDET